MFSLLVSVKNLSYFPCIFIQVLYKLFRKMIVSIYLFLLVGIYLFLLVSIYLFLFSVLWEHSVKYKYLYILDQIVYWLTSVSCMLYR